MCDRLPSGNSLIASLGRYFNRVAAGFVKVSWLVGLVKPS